MIPARRKCDFRARWAGLRHAWASFWQNEQVEFINENKGAFPACQLACCRHAVARFRFRVSRCKAAIDEGQPPPYFPRSILREICPRRARTAGGSHESPQFLEIAARSAPQQPAGAAPRSRLCDQQGPAPVQSAAGLSAAKSRVWHRKRAGVTRSLRHREFFTFWSAPACCIAARA